MKINLRIMNSIFIFIFLVFSIIFPGDILGIKKILLFILIVINIKPIYESIVLEKNFYIAFFSIIFPFSLFAYSAFLTSDLDSSFSRSFSPYILIIWFIIVHFKINFEKLFLVALVLLSSIIVSIWLMDILKISDINYGFINTFFYENDMGFMGKSTEYPLYYKIFLKSSPLIIFLLFYFFSKKNVIKSIIVFLVLALTGTRANVLFPTILLILYYILHNKFNKVIKYIFIFAMMFLLVVFSNEIVSNLESVFIDKSVTSDLVRSGHLKGLIELISNNPLIVLFGSGMGSEFYSYGVSMYVDSMELSYLDLLRQMGIGFFILFMIFIIYPFFSKKNQLYKKYAFFCYLLIAATNPLLFSSTAYIAYIYMYTYNEKENLNEK